MALPVVCAILHTSSLGSSAHAFVLEWPLFLGVREWVVAEAEPAAVGVHQRE